MPLVPQRASRVAQLSRNSESPCSLGSYGLSAGYVPLMSALIQTPDAFLDSGLEMLKSSAPSLQSWVSLEVLKLSLNVNGVFFSCRVFAELLLINIWYLIEDLL